jgi:hypothetical protein
MGATGPPLALIVQTAGGDQAMQVRVMRQVASPGVQRHQQARNDTQALRVGH